MPISFTARLKASPDILISEVGGESVLLNLNNEQYFGLDDVGTEMWKVLVAADSIQAAYETLLAEYDVEATRLQQDLHDLIEKLLEQGLVEVGSE